MALRRITLRDCVIVPTLDLDLADGFTVLTGETGAGKTTTALSIMRLVPDPRGIVAGQSRHAAFGVPRHATRCQRRPGA